MEPITTSLIGDLLSVLGLEELGPLELFEAVDLRAPGWSFLQPITTSHISGHYFEKPGNHPHIHMDFYSCDSVDWHQIAAVVDKHLSLADWRASFITRGWGAESREYTDIAGLGGQVVTETPLTANVTPVRMRSLKQTPVMQ